jgi:glycosyltransferase involved in cell wall biosynthesis
VSVVLCARNEQRFIGDQLAALELQDPGMPWEVIVVDNASTDGTIEVVEHFTGRIPVRVLHEGVAGQSRARNTGVAAARYPLIGHCDADDEVTPGWLAAVVAGLKSSPIVSGPMDEVELNRSNLWSRPRLPDTELPAALNFLPYAVGANIGYRREVHLAIGGWDEAFTAGAGDVDFSWRAQQAGFEITFCRDAIVRYRHRESGRQLARQFFGYGLNEPLLFKRHRHHGLPRERVRQVGRRWLNLVKGAPRVRNQPGQRRDWLMEASWSAGRAVGSIRDRSWFA